MHIVTVSTYAVAKKSLKKIGALAGINPDCDVDAGLQPICVGKPRNWELIIKFVCIVPEKDEDEMTNT